jgi:hypothetical protein
MRFPERKNFRIGLFFIVRKQVSWLNTILLWQHIWRIVWLSLMDNHPSMLMLPSMKIIEFVGLYISNISRPQALVPGMNSFLRQLEITFRRDPENARPRINKKDSVKVNSILP